MVSNSFHLSGGELPQRIDYGGAWLPQQALKAAEDAEDRWVADSAESRKEALQCAQAASAFAGQTYKHLRLVHSA